MKEFRLRLPRIGVGANQPLLIPFKINAFPPEVFKLGKEYKLRIPFLQDFADPLLERTISSQ